VRRGCTNCGFERLREFSGEVSKKLLNLREPPKSNQIKSLQIWNPDLLQHNRKRSLCGGTAKKSLVGGWFGMGPKPNFPLSSRRATSPPPPHHHPVRFRTSSPLPKFYSQLSEMKNPFKKLFHESNKGTAVDNGIQPSGTDERGSP
jgi:hypothetical protein